MWSRAAIEGGPPVLVLLKPSSASWNPLMDRPVEPITLFSTIRTTAFAVQHPQRALSAPRASREATLGFPSMSPA